MLVLLLLFCGEDSFKAAFTLYLKLCNICKENQITIFKVHSYIYFLFRISCKVHLAAMKILAAQMNVIHENIKLGS